MSSGGSWTEDMSWLFVIADSEFSRWVTGRYNDYIHTASNSEQRGGQGRGREDR